MHASACDHQCRYLVSPRSFLTGDAQPHAPRTVGLMDVASGEEALFPQCSHIEDVVQRHAMCVLEVMPLP